jgi:hypothetical protein
VEAGNQEFAYKTQKFTPKKNRNQKKNSTVVDREFDSLSTTVEFFGPRIFSLGELLYANCC